MERYKAKVGTSMVRCAALGVALPSAAIIAGHLLRRSHEILLDEVHIDNIDDARNGLLLFDPLEKAFDAFRIFFVYSACDDAFLLRIGDPLCRQEKLVSARGALPFLSWLGIIYIYC